MKRLKTIIPVVLAVALLLSACKGFSFSLTTMNDKMTLEAFGAKDGSFIDSGYVGVGEGRAAVVTSSLEKGQVQIEIIEVIVFPGADIDDEDDVIEGDVAYTLTVGSDDQEKISVKSGDYIVRFTAVGETAGKTTISFEKE